MRVLFPFVLLAACQDYNLEKREPGKGEGPQIEVTPNPLEFDSLPAGETDTKTFTIKSVGLTALDVSEIRILDGEAYTLTNTGEGLGLLQPDESVDVAVTWTSSGLADEDQAIVFSDDGRNPETYVDLVAGGLTPELCIDPSSVDFGNVAVGTTAEEDVTLSNCGDAPLTISELTETESVFGHTFNEVLPVVLAPNEEMIVTSQFTPATGDSYTGKMHVESDDPDGRQSVDLNGVGAADTPVAVCEADPDTVEALHESTTWKGSASYDPNGYAITEYRWTLESAPGGSRVTMPDGSANRSGFTPDVVGEYIAKLVVANELGERSDPCLATLTATAGEGLWVEIYWTHSGDDMDLHLLAPGGRTVSDSDCYYGNCTGSGLDWGVRGDRDDDPVLDIDDIPGTGPENINIDAPENGTFTAIVHDYPGSVYNGENLVTMNIYIGGYLEWTDTRDVNREDLYEEFAEIDYPSGTVTGL